MRFIIAFLLALTSFAAHASTMSRHDLQHYLERAYPRTSSGKLNVTLHSPRIAKANTGTDIEIHFEAFVRSADGSVRYNHILAKVSGPMFLSDGKIRFKEISDLLVLSDSVPYTYKTLTQRAIKEMIIGDYITSPIIAVHQDNNGKRAFPSFFVEELTIVE